MEKNETPVKGIIQALAKFQKECPAIKKDSTAGTEKFSYQYGSLPHILEIIQPHLEKAKLTFTQPISWREGKQFLYTKLYHLESGECIESKVEIPDVQFQGMNPFQSFGSGVTYLRRYALISVLGIVPDEDDNDAQGKAEKKSDKPAEPEKPWLNREVRKGSSELTEAWTKAVAYLAKDEGTIADIKKKYRISKKNEEDLKNEALAYSDIPGLNKEPGELFTDNEEGAPY